MGCENYMHLGEKVDVQRIMNINVSKKKSRIQEVKAVMSLHNFAYSLPYNFP